MVQIHSRWRAWIIVAMMFVFMLINFADKAVIGLAAVPIMRDLALTPQQFGMVGSSFFVLFSISGVLFGFAANKVKTKWLLALLSAVWAAVQFPLTGAVSLPLLIACRVALGAGEGPAYPLAMHATYKWFENEKRNIPSAIVQQGATTGMLLAGPLLTFLIIHYDWHCAFLVLGAIGALWTILWMVIGAEGTVGERHSLPPSTGTLHVPYRRLITDPTLLGCVLLTFVAYTVLSAGFTWFPAYLRLGLGYPAGDVGWIFSLIVGVSIPVSLLASYLSQRLTRRAVSSRLSRGVMTSLPVAAAGLILLGTTTELEAGMKVVCLALTSALSQLPFLFGPLLIGEVTPTGQRGAWLAINTSLGTVAGIFAPALMGHLIGAANTTSAGYQHGFLLLSCILIPSGFLGIWLLNPEKSRCSLRRKSDEENRQNADAPSCSSGGSSR
ncbi:MFS transporter [Paraburkholderia domus]|uniref:MFS transporter n=1 Tax=Paraburkholderia domus TaxID=2793075 RepID=UPI0019118ACB|nr:MFS transporter [Paraburkholderia domus]MBK5185568.1 MFS transporter [Burkholderia sp. R-69749]CAE6881373.1 putative sulfoacetate transporter SauU [Paraburkholderia domus]